MEKMQRRILKMVGWEVFQDEAGQWLAILPGMYKGGAVHAEDAWIAYDSRFLVRRYGTPA